MKKGIKLVASLLMTGYMLGAPSLVYASAINSEITPEQLATIERAKQSTSISISPLTEEDNTNIWSIFFNKEKDMFEVVYTIEDGSEDTVVIDLSQVQEVLRLCAQSELDQKSEEELKEHASSLFRLSVGNQTNTGANIVDYHYAIDGDALYAMLYELPADTLLFNVTIKNKSGKVYDYKEGSFVISTNETGVEESDIIAFDGQKLSTDDNEYMTENIIKIGYNYGDMESAMNNLVDEALVYAPATTSSKFCLNADGTITKTGTNITMPVGTKVYLVNNIYLVKIGDNYARPYSAISKSYVKTVTDEDGNQSLVLKTAKTTKWYLSNEKAEYVFVTVARKPSSTTQQVSTTDAQKSINKYLTDKYEGNVENYMLEYYNKVNNTSYTDFDTMLSKDSRVIADLVSTSTVSLYRLTINDSSAYDNFYNYLLSIVIDDTDAVKSYYDEKGTAWSYKNDDKVTVGAYMCDKVDTENEGQWDKTDKYFSKNFNNFTNESEKTFGLGVNLDGPLTGNYYQSTKFGWYSSIQLEAVKGSVTINYVDVKGDTLLESETKVGYVGQSFDTAAATIEGYELVKSPESETGVYTRDSQEVTYVYEFVMGEGGEDLPPLVQTGVDVDYSVMSSALITLTLAGLVVYTRKNRE